MRRERERESVCVSAADSALLVDYFIFFGNAPGIILGFFYTLTGEKERKKEKGHAHV